MDPEGGQSRTIGGVNLDFAKVWYFNLRLIIVSGPLWQGRRRALSANLAMSDQLSRCRWRWDRYVGPEFSRLPDTADLKSPPASAQRVLI
jgi:hypothetical protein